MVFAVAIKLSVGAGRYDAIIFKECTEAASLAVGNFYLRTELTVQGLGLGIGIESSNISKAYFIQNMNLNMNLYNPGLALALISISSRCPCFFTARLTV